MSLSFSRYVRFIFHACPVFSLRASSLHLPSCRLVALSFVSLSFTLHSPCFHLCPFHVPFSSPLFPFHFPLLSCHVDFLFPPLISLHFLAFPLCSPAFPARKSRQGDSSLRLVERHQITARYVGPPPLYPTYQTSGGGVLGRLSSILS